MIIIKEIQFFFFYDLCHSSQEAQKHSESGRSCSPLMWRHLEINCDQLPLGYIFLFTPLRVSSCVFKVVPQSAFGPLLSKNVQVKLAVLCLERRDRVESE